MKQRKNWTNEEDKVLKHLIEDRKMSKWSQISEVMEKQFDLSGRNGKQCRQRYHNHLDKNIINQEWSLEEEDKLFEMQDRLGNKWALISSKLPGRTDNCVKNHFYSKLRKSLRKLNKKIHKYLKREYKDIKTSTLYKVIETMENRNRLGSNIPAQTEELCRKIKNQLRRYEDETDCFQNQQDELIFIRSILEDIIFFDKDIKKNAKKGNLKSSTKLQGGQEYTPSTKSNNTYVMSTKSVYDEEESQYSNSDIFSSSSIDHRSFCSNRSQRLLRVDKMTCKSHSIASESEDEEDSDLENENENQNSQFLYKSAQLKKEIKTEQVKPKTNYLSGSLTLPILSQNLHPRSKKETLEVMEDKKSSSSSKSGSHKSKEEDNQNLMTYKYMMQGEEPFAMRLFSPKKLTIQEKIEMNAQQDDLFFGSSMQIQDDNLIMKIEGMSINGIPKLGHTMDL